MSRRRRRRRKTREKHRLRARAHESRAKRPREPDSRAFLEPVTYGTTAGEPFLPRAAPPVRVGRDHHLGRGGNSNSSSSCETGYYTRANKWLAKPAARESVRLRWSPPIAESLSGGSRDVASSAVAREPRVALGGRRAQCSRPPGMHVFGVPLLRATLICRVRASARLRMSCWRRWRFVS